jgi:hypothetical protein
MKIVLHVSQSPQRDNLQIASCLGLSLCGLFESGGFTRLPALGFRICCGTLFGQFNVASLKEEKVGHIREAEDSIVRCSARRIHQKAECSTTGLFCLITIAG